jgi:hypothetical protein
VSWPLLFACLWALAATATAMLPMRLQFAPGLLLLVSAPVLVVWIGVAHGWWVAGLGLAAFVSMFRRPLGYLARRALGRPAARPDERA